MRVTVTQNSLIEGIVSDNCPLRQSFLVIILLEFSHYHRNGTPGRIINKTDIHHFHSNINKI